MEVCQNSVAIKASRPGSRTFHQNLNYEIKEFRIPQSRNLKSEMPNAQMKLWTNLGIIGEHRKQKNIGYHRKLDSEQAQNDLSKSFHFLFNAFADSD